MPKCHVQQEAGRAKLKKIESDSTYVVLITSLDIKRAQGGTSDLCSKYRVSDILITNTCCHLCVVSISFVNVSCMRVDEPGIDAFVIS